jgi:2-oxoisovalerate dehydrogenase E2 component (dihydrolipoyl transacylase)
VLVGYGPKTTTAARRPRKGAVPAGASAATAQQAVQTSMMTTPTPVREPEVEDAPESAPAHTVATGSNGAGVRVLAKPPVRKLAKDLGVDLTTVTPTGDGGVVTRSDVEQAAAGGPDTSGSRAPAYAPAAGQRETRVPVKGVRKMTAQAMVSSAFTAPHVTEWVTVDVTRTMELVEKLRSDKDFRDVRVSPLLVLMKAMLLAARRHPDINATWDEAAQEIVVKHYVNLGIAAATPRGLVVPNIKDADRMSLRELAEALGTLVDTARAGRTQPADMAGGTMTITNVGVFGVDAGTPILNPGESAILCFGQVRPMPWVHEGQLAVRQVTQLALSFDHRMVDGQLGSMFLADVARVLEDPATALLW